MHYPAFMKGNYGMVKDRYFVLMILISIVLLIIIAGSIAWKVNSYSCYIDQQKYHRHTHYTFLVGCFIETEPKVMVGLEQFQNFHSVK